MSDLSEMTYCVNSQREHIIRTHAVELRVINNQSQAWDLLDIFVLRGWTG